MEKFEKFGKSNRKRKWTYEGDDIDWNEITQVLQVYNTVKNYSLKYSKKSSLFALLDKLNTEYEYKERNVCSLWIEILSRAHDYYLNKSNLYLPDLEKLLNVSEHENIMNVRYSLLEKIFKYKSPFYDYVYIPKSLCIFLDTNDINQNLTNFITSLRSKGNFMSNYVATNVDMKRKIYNERITKVQNEMMKSINFKLMFNWYNRYDQENIPKIDFMMLCGEKAELA